jgi:hypothetical protein
MEPLTPRITKSTAIAAIKARFETEEELLKRFEVAKGAANLWDGERDGLREAVKTLEGGQYGNTILSWSTSAEVMYPNSSGKHQLENTLQCTIPRADTGIGLQAYGCGFTTPEAFSDEILSRMQHGKAEALRYMQHIFLGEGITVNNNTLYEKKGSDKSTITVLPP